MDFNYVPVVIPIIISGNFQYVPGYVYHGSGLISLITTTSPVQKEEEGLSPYFDIIKTTTTIAMTYLIVTAKQDVVWRKPMPKKLYVGSVGTTILIDVGEDISGATTAAIDVQKPDGMEVTWVGDVYDHTKVRYITIANDIDQSGWWKLRPHIVMPSPGYDGPAATIEIMVYDEFN
jgi:hypothetical protein